MSTDRKHRLTSLTVGYRSSHSADIAEYLIERYIKKVLSRTSFDIGSKMSNFLATGNLVSPSGLDLQQTSGFTIVAEKLNWQRYISHFRSIHRGAFFAELKTTTVRKLLPEAWGTPPVFQTYIGSTVLCRLPLSCPHT